MWLIILFVALFLLAVGGGTWGRSRYSYWSWSPAAVILVVFLVVYLSGGLRLHG